jgi:catechol 2,3-dioxygenase-like lactoylglutathione lyase family enzyme
MFRRVDRVILRVANLPAAVSFYKDKLGLELIRSEQRLAIFRLPDDGAELILHIDPDQPAEAIYYLVEDVRDLYSRRAELNLKFLSPPAQAARGYRATIKDPLGMVWMVLDRAKAASAGKTPEDARIPGGLFAGVETRSTPKRDLLSQLYVKVGRTADDLPYTPHFENIYDSYAAAYGESRPSQAEVWRHLLNLRKAGKLPKLGEARSPAPDVSEKDRARLRELLGKEAGRRDRLPYTPLFEKLVNDFNEDLDRALSPHLIWRLVATLAK